MAAIHHGKAWKRLRAAALARDGRRCRRCGKAGILEVDHVRPVRAGGDPFELGNVQTLCRGCHIAKTRAEAPPVPAAVTAWRDLVAERLGA